MSQMYADISRIVDEDISNRVDQYNVIIEAITNAIHANATKITCHLNSNDIPMKDEDGNEMHPKKLKTIIITDNGDGMNDENYGSFSVYRSKYKKDIGAKGIGRLIFLKVYKSAKYISRLTKLQEERIINFDNSFDPSTLQKTSYHIDTNYTEVSLTNLNENYYNSSRYVDRRIDLVLEKIKEKILVNLIPTLYFYKKNETKISIEIIDETTSESMIIDHHDIPDFHFIDFTIKGNDNIEYLFTLNYKINKIEGNLHSFYCANNRTVIEFKKKEFKLSLPYGYSGFFLLESVYFDEKVNNERNDFDIFQTRTDLFSTISWEMINEELKRNISDLVKEGIPETEEINKVKIKEIHEERPYLIDYIDDNDIDIAGFMDKKQIIEKAKKSFDTAKEQVLKNAGKSEYTDSELIEAINLAQSELVSYVLNRVHVIERLKTMIDKKEKVESVIHNLFMKKGMESDYFCVERNNLWLLDDRFTTYSYAASEKRIEEILKSLGEDTNVDNPLDRPDLSIFFSKNPTESNSLKAVIVEIKPFDFESKPDRKKYEGIQQLIDYVKAFQKNNNIEEIYAFLVTDIDKKFEERLKDNNFTPLFSLDTPIFHHPYKELGLSIYVISVKSIVDDAEARNKVFLDIIKKQSRLKKIIM